MEKDKRFSIRARVGSIRYAINGLVDFFRGEHNAWLHLIATVAVIILSLVFPVSRTELLALVFAVGFVWTAEIFNTVIEKIMDFIAPDIDGRIKFIKDLSAAAVLISAITALTIGCIVFIPKL
jgi:diacylglycerol kinase (ATP)